MIKNNFCSNSRSCSANTFCHYLQSCSVNNTFYYHNSQSYYVNILVQCNSSVMSSISTIDIYSKQIISGTVSSPGIALLLHNQDCIILTASYTVGTDCYICSIQERRIRNVKLQCEEGCQNKVGLDQLSCVRHCMSPQCYDELYAHDPVGLLLCRVLVSWPNSNVVNITRFFYWYESTLPPILFVTC